jgi:predicted amidohydrolase YtcJ
VASGDPKVRPDSTTRAFTGGRILTMERAAGEAEVVVVEGARIAAVGGRDLLQAFPGVRVEDLAGRTLLPGFIDAHNHLSIAALHPIWADLSAVRNLDELQRALAAQAEREPEAPWIRGVGWDHTQAGVLPDRHTLDALGFDRPVIVAHFTLHQCVVSSRGLEELQIGRETPDPPGGSIERGDRGEPTGLLIERAWSEAHARSVAAHGDPDRWAQLIAARARVLLADGITCVHDAACSPSAEAVYRHMAAEGALPFCVLVLPHAEGILGVAPTERLDGPLTGEGDETLRVGPVKFFADGGIAPAVDACIAGQRMNLGMRFDDLQTNLVEAVRRGFRVAVHAMGNAGLQATVEAFGAAERARPGEEHRFRVEHATLASPGQIRDLASLGAIGVVQPGFVNLMGRHVEHIQFDDEIWMPFADLARAGIVLAASSDDPCAAYEPLRTSTHGVTRRTGNGTVLGAEQALGYESWLHAYTAGAAFAGGQERERGSLAPGKRADLVVLDGDLDAEHPPLVSQTWVAGELVHEAPAPR